MSRIIKFRGWDRVNNKMLSWKEILMSEWLLFSFFGNEAYCTNPPKPFWERMQFTGLHDKNGKEIYEGDVVIYEHPYSDKVNMEVTWSERQCAFHPLDCFHKSFEVIGNIYEHNHLIKDTP